MARRFSVASTCVLAALFWGSSSFADDATAHLGPSPELVERTWEVTEAILDHHIDPPTRQQMVLEGIKAAYRMAGTPVPAKLGKRVSSLTSRSELREILTENWPLASGSKKPETTVEEALIDGMLGSVPGHAQLLTAKEAKVAEQFEGNLYVGIQITLGYDDEAKLPKIYSVFEGGPAERAGVKADDLLEQIDGLAMRGVKLREAVDRLRGAEGTKVVIKVRRANRKDLLTFELTRTTLPRQTITGVAKQSSGEWTHRIGGSDPIAYIRIRELAGSTPHELRNLASKVEVEGARAIILDLRETSQASLHASVLLADSLLESAPIGRVRQADNVITYQSDADALFRGLPLAVLLDGKTTGPAEWLAAALQDNHRAVIIGSPTEGSATTRSSVPIAGGRWFVTMVTGVLERSDGRPLQPSPNLFESPPRVIAARAPDTKRPRGGVTPDVSLSAATPPAVAVAPQRSPGAPSAKPATPRPRSGPYVEKKAEPSDAPDVMRDPVLLKAVEILRAKLRQS
jgi:carboxyl-terminal processing protease